MLDNIRLKRKRPLANRIYCGAKSLFSAQTGSRITKTSQQWIESGKNAASNIRDSLHDGHRPLANRIYCRAKNIIETRRNMRPSRMMRAMAMRRLHAMRRRRSMPERAYRQARKVVKDNPRPFAGAGLALILLGLMGGVWYLVRQQEKMMVAEEEYDSRSGGMSADEDLQVIEGIGPKVESVLKSAGVTSLSRLSRMDPEEIRAILRDADLRFLDPATWPEQARLAAAGDWTGLDELNSTLRAGRRM
jgi:hypothetical protein